MIETQLMFLDVNHTLIIIYTRGARRTLIVALRNDDYILVFARIILQFSNVINKCTLYYTVVVVVVVVIIIIINETFDRNALDEILCCLPTVDTIIIIIL